MTIDTITVGAVFTNLGIDGKKLDKHPVYAVIDSTGDNYADIVTPVTQPHPAANGVAYLDGNLYVAEISKLWLYTNIDDHIFDENPPTPTLLLDNKTLPTSNWHGWRYMKFHEDTLYFAIGAPCNVPCDQDCDCLVDPLHGTIVTMKSDGTDIQVYSKGIRNSVGFDFHPETGDMWFTDNGRDNWGNDNDEISNRPPDELNHATKRGEDFGYPHCYGKDMVDEQFNKNSSCDGYIGAHTELISHAAALGMRFYTGSMFPKSYKNNIFIAEHGSWNRDPVAGYRVTYVDINGDYDVFVDGWLPNDGKKECNNDDDCPGAALCQTTHKKCGGWGRPADVEVLPDGSMLISDEYGIIWRVSYRNPSPVSKYWWVILLGGSALVIIIAAILMKKKFSNNYATVS
eukprot:TRINITY_DN1790_c0_g1_i2.p1 TRINITY_DN1790_c0_g1~~TRINITY_DN1790_c0_g1_i2.p1  ORF type:complete len:400 (-),score=97.19 TRINITY_DN1790_c0_g1_i2:36-1235(-)